MAIIHNNVLYSHLNEDGDRILDFPITKSECVDGLDERIRQVSVLDGLDEASKGQVPSKSSEGLEWFTPVRAVYLGEGGTSITPTDSGDIVIPVAGENLGVVKESNEIDVDENGVMTLKSVNAEKIKYNEYNSIKEVLDQRTSWEHF